MAADPVFAIPNVRRFIAFRVFFNARFYYPVFTVLFIDFGLSLSQFAVLNAVWAAAIVTLEVPSGALADIIGRRNLVVAAAVMMVIEIGLLCIVPLGNSGLLMAAFVLNRLLSGAAEAAASGADEALAYDSLLRNGDPEDWGRVLERQTRLTSAGFIVTMSLGAAVYDPQVVQTVAAWAGFDGQITRATTLRWPLYLTLFSALAALAAALGMRETAPAEQQTGPTAAGCTRSLREALKLTLQAGRWILRTPAVLVIIVAGLLFDHVIRMLITLASQYYRTIEIPEGLFGLIGSALALLGLFVPRLAHHLAKTRPPGFNLAIMALATTVGLWGVSRCVPAWGLLPMAVLMAVMYLNGFFQSHYLNRLTASGQRATVLSFKGLCFNLGYGFIGIAYSLLLAGLRGDLPPARGDGETMVFVSSLTWFPPYFLAGLAIFAVFARRRLKGNALSPEGPGTPG